jgi:P27 family predicted phage terminase small subunit
MTGRPRLSDEEKKKRGTYKPSRGSGEEVQDVVMVDAGEPDSIFPLSAHGRELWDTITKTMVSYKTLAEVDIMTISMLCVEYDQYLECIDKPIIDIDANGNVKPSAYVTIKNAALQNILKLSMQLGITTMMRMKIRKPDDGPKKKDAAAKFFS